MLTGGVCLRPHRRGDDCLKVSLELLVHGDVIRCDVGTWYWRVSVGIRPRWGHGDGAIPRARAVHVIGEWTYRPAANDVTQYQRCPGHSLSLVFHLRCGTRVYSGGDIQGICLAVVMNAEN